MDQVRSVGRSWEKAGAPMICFFVYKWLDRLGRERERNAALYEADFKKRGLGYWSCDVDMRRASGTIVRVRVRERPPRRDKMDGY